MRDDGAAPRNGQLISLSQFFHSNSTSKIVDGERNDVSEGTLLGVLWPLPPIAGLICLDFGAEGCG